ncbi:uncharacterized protein LOC108740551 [Agrilus planipennis]|uniref:Uncharacterized protein LOC108740551 n=1 Tax=Agrilus planipennis TaxID=224129 RepID=A0A1W4X2R2_AGRPL|nr:uncharacterized protein LOC108740551 [Agrilus planipennis]
MEFRMFPSVFKFFVVLLLLNIARAYQECISEHNVFPHETDVTKYYKCNKQHKKIQMQCPHTMQFNPSVGMCQNFIKQDQFMNVPSSQQRPPFYPDAPFHTHQPQSSPSTAANINKPGTPGKHNHGIQYAAYPDSPYHTENYLRTNPYYFTGTHYPSKPFYYKPSHIGSGYLQPYHPHHHTIDYGDSYGQNYQYDKPYDQGPSYLYPSYGSRSFTYKPFRHGNKSKFNSNHSHHGNKPHHYGQPR